MSDQNNRRFVRLVCRKQLQSLALIMVAGGLLLSCANRELAKVDPDDNAVNRLELNVEPNRNIDILFVIDNSKSMSEEQISLADNFPKFIEKLESIDGGLPNIHIGVISTDLGAGDAPEHILSLDCAPGGDGGKLQFEARPDPQSECDGQIPAIEPECIGMGLDDLTDDGEGNFDTFIKDVLSPDRTSRERNYSTNTDIDAESDPDQPTLADVFSCIAPLGKCGCRFEQPLEAIKRALDPTVNPGFLRENAYLAVIIITDEDDCSLAEPMPEPSMFLSEPFEQETGQPTGSFLCFKHGVVCDSHEDPMVTGTREDCRPRPGTTSDAENRSQFMTDVDEYAEFLKGLKPQDPGLVIVAQIVGGTSPVTVISELEADTTVENPREFITLGKQCQLFVDDVDPPFVAAEASPAIRLNAFAQRFPQRNVSTTICQEDLSDALVQIGTLLRNIVGSRCVEGNIDLDPEKDNVQHECVVAETQNLGTADEASISLRECSSETPSPDELPCWRFELDTEECKGTATELRLIDERGGANAPPDTKLRLECVLKR